MRVSVVMLAPLFCAASIPGVFVALDVTEDRRIETAVMRGETLSQLREKWNTTKRNEVFAALSRASAESV